MHEYIHSIYASFIQLVHVDDPAKIIGNIPDKLNVTAGDSVSISCAASGNPLPSISWRKDGVQLSSSRHIDITSNSVNSTFVNSVLTIISVKYYDKAVYTCTAKNTLPNNRIAVYSANITLDVFCKFVFDY